MKYSSAHSTVQKDLYRIEQIEAGLIEDDLTNHAYSHFGFYDPPARQDMTPGLGSSIPFGTRLPESTGVGTSVINTGRRAK